LVSEHLSEFAIFITSSLKHFTSATFIRPDFLSSAIKGLSPNILFKADSFHGLASAGLADDSDGLFGLMLFLFPSLTSTNPNLTSQVVQFLEMRSLDTSWVSPCLSTYIARHLLSLFPYYFQKIPILWELLEKWLFQCGSLLGLQRAAQ
jgi:hypothetical protein